MQGRGVFITFEGGEGSGKSTQARLLVEALQADGVNCRFTREPGGAVLSEKIRGLLVESSEEEWMPESEMLLFMAARVEHIRKVIEPALKRGEIVICDRFHDSSRIYQGVAKNLGIDMIDRLYALTVGRLAPDITFLLDIDPEVGLRRAAGRHHNETRFEALGIEFHRTLREGFFSLAKREPERFTVLDATMPLKVTHDKIYQKTQLWLN